MRPEGRREQAKEAGVLDTADEIDMGRGLTSRSKKTVETRAEKSVYDDILGQKFSFRKTLVERKASEGKTLQSYELKWVTVIVVSSKP